MNLTDEVLSLASSAIQSTTLTIDSSQENTPEWDSLAHMHFISSLCERYSLQLDQDMVYNCLSIKKALNYLSSKGLS